MPNTLPTDLLISIAQIRDQAVTVNMIGHYPPHIGKLAAMHLQRLLKGGAIKLPKDASAIRIKLELSNNRFISWESHRVIQTLIANISVPTSFSSAEKTSAQALLNLDYAVSE